MSIFTQCFLTTTTTTTRYIVPHNKISFVWLFVVGEEDELSIKEAAELIVEGMQFSGKVEVSFVLFPWGCCMLYAGGGWRELADRNCWNELIDPNSSFIISLQPDNWDDKYMCNINANANQSFPLSFQLTIKNFWPGALYFLVCKQSPRGRKEGKEEGKRACWQAIYVLFLKNKIEKSAVLIYERR